MERSEFLKLSGSAAGSVLLFSPVSLLGEKGVKFGIIADLHHDIMHDGIDRLSAFIGEMNQAKPDFIVQLGDFCVPKEENKALMKVWDQFTGPKYHVIGNHDMDGGYTREQVVDFWKAKGNYYSFDVNSFHFVVLDGNEQNESPDRPPGYAHYISEQQLEWLEKDLSQTSLPTVVLCHQGLDNDAGGLENGTSVRYVLEEANKQSRSQQVMLVLTGHHHQDYYNHINDIHYVQINSASYQWLGEDYQEIRYSEKVDEAHPWIKYTVPYREPLWAVIESKQGQIAIQGKKSSFIGSSPAELGVNIREYIYPIVPYISDRKLEV